MAAAGDILNDRYQLDRQVGQGGFARVYLGQDRLLRRRVAIKVLHPDLADPVNAQEFVVRFERETQAVAALEHPHILLVYDYGKADGTVFLVMPFVDGGTLLDRLRAEPILPLPATAAWLAQAAAALYYAHRRDLIHRDVKPENMLVRAEDAHLLLADFGIAKVLSAASSQSRTGVVGTLAGSVG